MAEMKSLDQHLQRRGGRWHYIRRIPARFRKLDGRGTIRTALDTSSLQVARARRDAMVEADDQYWAHLALQNEQRGAVDMSRQRYEAARTRAKARGFIYTPLPELTATINVEDLLKRLSHAVKHEPDAAEVEAVMGAVPPVSESVREAFALYCDKLAVSDLANKSPDQKTKWKATKSRSVEHFIKLCGNLPMDKITRGHARKFYEWWGERIYPMGETAKTYRPNSANRELGNLRKLYREYWTYQGEETRENPFRNLRFKNKANAPTPAFASAWVGEKLLQPHVFEGVNAEAILLTYALIETGCRPSELANLQQQNIVLDCDTPHIRIREAADRELKSNASSRDIPLVGISLEAMKRAPNGFPHYRDKSALLSNSLMKAFRARDLLPTEAHRIYSFRHAFEKRMLEAGLDYGLRCTLMGHKNNRPQYGDGGSMEYRRGELLKIVHPVSAETIQSLPDLRG
jgi:integrase